MAYKLIRLGCPIRQTGGALGVCGDGYEAGGRAEKGSLERADTIKSRDIV